jgi:hypothetical protein
MGFFDDAKKEFEKKIKVATGKRLKSSAEQFKRLKEKKESFWERVKRGIFQKEDIQIREDIISPRRRPREGKFGIMEATAPPPEMPQQPQDWEVHSSAIDAMGYDPEEKILEIEFVEGGVYHYYQVPKRIWNSLKTAPSKGKAFHNLVYGEWVGPEGNKTYFPNYTYRRIA